MWAVAFFASLAFFVAMGVLLAGSQTRYLRLYRDVHRDERPLWAQWQWRADGRVTASLFQAFSARQNMPELERRRLEARRWQLATVGALILTCLVGVASQRF